MFRLHLHISLFFQFSENESESVDHRDDEKSSSAVSLSKSSAVEESAVTKPKRHRLKSSNSKDVRRPKTSTGEIFFRFLKTFCP